MSNELDQNSHEDNMKRNVHNNSCFTLIAAVGILFALSFVASAQTPAPPQQPDNGADPISQLHLTPEQRQKIRSIAEDNREERMKINLQLREAQDALQQTLDSDNPTESAVEERIRDLSSAQTAQVRMRAMTELRIRSVLTPEQRQVWRELRAQRQNLRRQMKEANGGGRDPQQLPNERNGIAPLFQKGRRNGVPATPKPQP